jgi:hypothetical protein
VIRYAHRPLERANETERSFEDMQQPHSTTGYYKTYLRIALMFVISVQFSFLIPSIEDAEKQGFYWNQSVNMGILYAIIVGFLMSLSLTRKQLIEEKIGIELNKIRRLYHLALHIRTLNPELAKWYDAFITAIRDYLNLFCKNDFSKYEDGDPLFRRITYAVYQIPAVTKEYNSELYQFLIDTAGEATEARQFIKQKKDDYIGHFQWGVIIVITVTFAGIMTAATARDLVSRSVTTLVIFNLFLALDLLNEYDRINAKKSRYLADLYVQNLPEIADCPVTKKSSRFRKRLKKATLTTRVA